MKTIVVPVRTIVSRFATSSKFKADSRTKRLYGGDKRAIIFVKFYKKVKNSCDINFGVWVWKIN